MIEAIVPRKSVECKVNGNYKGQTVATVTVKKNEAGNEEQAPTPKIVITDNLQALRKIQYETIEQLCNLRMVLTGENCQDTINALDENAVDTLMNLTATICQQGAVINKFVKECRELIGA